MKKFITTVLVWAMVVSLMTVVTVPGRVEANNYSLTITSDSPIGVVHKNQIVKARYTIRTSNPMVGASARIYIDGVLQPEAGSQYFVLYGENKEGFDFMVPSGLDPAYIHTLGIELVDDNGMAANCYQQFRVSAYAPDIRMNFTSEPVVVNEGVDLYYKVRFTLPDAHQSHAVNLRYEINGYAYPELDETVAVSNGSEICKMIPVKYVNAKNKTYTLTVRLNPDNDAAICHNYVTSIVPTVNYNTVDFESVKAKVNPVVIPAQIMKKTDCFGYANLTGYKTTLNAGTMVEYMNPDSSESMKSARIKTANGGVYWVPMSNIYVSRLDYTKPDTLTAQEREIFVNGMGYSSSTAYLIWVHKECQRLSVFIGQKGSWSHLKTFPVATGTNLTPTPTTVCKYQYMTRWVEEDYICYPVLALYDGYAIHNQPVSHSGYITDRTIGKPASHGCIRMLQADVNWVYSYVPVKSTVVLY